MTVPADVQKSDSSAWLAVAGAIFGTFMALLDVSVTNASLPQIQGEIGATGTEGTWIGTGYLVAEIVMIPLTAWFGRLLGLRNFLIVSSLGFTAFSMVCGLSTSLAGMIIGRVGQGFFGGALIPASLTIIATRLTPAQRPIGLAVYAAVAVLAPVIGPVLGGWLTEDLSWHWIFFMNLPIAGLLVLMLVLGIEKASAQWDELSRADWPGIAGMTLLLSATTIILEEGQRENWFDSSLIKGLAGAATVGLLLVLYAQLTSTQPVVKLRLLLNRSFGAVFAINMLIGSASFTLLYVIPVFLGTIAGYNAKQTGMVAMYSGLTTFLMMPFIIVMLQKIDIRLIVASGIAIFAFGCFAILGLTSQSVGSDFLTAQIAIGMGQPLIGLPISQAATAGLQSEEISDGTALFSMSRNLGGSLGLALIGVLIDRRSAFHFAQFAQAVTQNSAAARELLERGLYAAHALDPAYTVLRTLKITALELHRQALVMSYVDGLWVMGIAILAIIPAAFLLARPSTDSTVATH